jgi:hypothetical protein
MQLVKGTVDPFPERLNRRRVVRVVPEQPAHCEVFGSASRITITDVSVGGMRVQSSGPFWQGARHVIRVSAGHHEPIELLARVVHCQRAVTDSGAPCFVVGWEFLAGPGAEDAARRLVETISGDGPFGLVS